MLGFTSGITFFEWSPPTDILLTLIWHFAWDSTWHIFWHSSWHVIHMFQHSIGQICWHAYSDVRSDTRMVSCILSRILSEIFAGTAFGSSKAATRSGTADINLQTLAWFLKGVGLVETCNEFCVFYDFHDPLKVYWLLGRHEVLKLTWDIGKQAENSTSGCSVVHKTPHHGWNTALVLR